MTSQAHRERELRQQEWEQQQFDIEVKHLLKVISTEEKRQRRDLLARIRDLMDRTSNDVSMKELRRMYKDLFGDIC